MVNLKQGSIIMTTFDPQIGHEQSGYRPAVVISNNFLNNYCNVVIVCPITNSDNHFPLHVKLDSRTKTTGVVLCEHPRSLDVNKRKYKYIEMLPKDLLKEVIDVTFSEIDIN